MNAQNQFLQSNTLLSQIQESGSFEDKRTVQNQYAKEMLLDDNFNISEIAYMIGFNNPQYFSKCFRSKYGVSPRKFRELNKKHIGKTNQKNFFLEKVNNLLSEKFPLDDYSLDSFANDMKMSKSSLYRKIKNLTGFSPCEYLRKMRIQKAKSLLNNSGRKVEDVALIVGFWDVKYFSRCFREETGKCPSQFIKESIFQ